MKDAPDTRRASRAFEDFTGRKARKLTVEKIDDGPVTGWELGTLVGVAYEATRDGERDRYFHEFAKSARPRLVAREDGRQLYIAGGRYNVTERGVEDMPSPLFVVNPSRRKGNSMAGRKSSTRKRRRGSAATIVVRQNPTHRRKRRVGARHRRRSGFLANPASRRTRRRSYKRNPSMRAGREKLMNLIVAAGGIGLGAVGSEILVGYLPLPAQAKTGTMLYVTKGAVGIAAGLLIGKVLKQPRLGKYVAAGAVAIAVHDAAKSLLLKSMPSVKFGEFMPRGRLGYMTPAQLVSPGSFAGVGQFVHGMDGAGPGGGGGGETNFHV